MSHISQELDDRLYQKAMFDKPLSPNYLGNPEVVGKLVADYCMAVRDALMHSMQGGGSMLKRLEENRDKYAEILSGKNAEYPPVVGWNDATLPVRLKTELGSYWNEHAAANDQDPVKCFLSWMAWAVADSMRKSNGDPDMEGVYLQSHTGQAIRLLLGTDKRAY